MNFNDPKIGRRFIILGEGGAKKLHIAEIGASNEVQDLIEIIDELVDRLYTSGAPAKLRVSE